MDHAELEERWLDLVEGTLPETEARETRAHLATCTACAARYDRLVASHALSTRVGREVRSARSAQVPDAVAGRVLSAARAAAAPRPARRRWAVPAFAALAAVASLALVVVRTRTGDPTGAVLVDGALALLAPQADTRGGEDATSAAAVDVAERWRNGALRPRAAAARCAGGEVRVAGLVDERGDPDFVAVREGDRTEVHVYGPAGREVGSARFIGNARSAFALPPLPRAAGRALLESPSCSDVRR